MNTALSLPRESLTNVTPSGSEASLGLAPAL